MLLDSRDSFEDDRNALTALAQMFFTRADTMQVSTASAWSLVSRTPLSSDVQNVPSVPLPPPGPLKSGFALSEIALVATLTSSEMDIPWQAAVCLKKMVEIEKTGFVSATEYSVEDARAREIAYTALGDNSVIVTGVWCIVTCNDMETNQIVKDDSRCKSGFVGYCRTCASQVPSTSPYGRSATDAG